MSHTRSVLDGSDRPIVYGACVGSQNRFENIAKRSIRDISPEAVIITRSGQRSICAAYNSILEEACDHDPVAVVLLHEDVELQDPEFEAKLRRVLDSNAAIALVGAIGGRAPRDMAWWESEERVGNVPDTFWAHTSQPREGDVDALDGILLTFSRWAVDNLRFDDARFTGFHGYDADICRQARSAGKRVVVADIRLLHHTSTPAGSATHAWHEALYAWRTKWVPGPLHERLTWRMKRLAHSVLARSGRG